MNPIVTSATTSQQKCVRTDPTAGTTTIDLTTPASTRKTNRSPTKLAIQALEGATASLPTSLHPLILHFGNKLISIHAKCVIKENIAQRMTREPNYIPQDPIIQWCLRRQRESLLPRTADPTSKGYLRILSEDCN